MNRNRRQGPGRIRRMQRHMGEAGIDRKQSKALNRISGNRSPRFALNTSPFRTIVNQLKETVSHVAGELRSSTGHVNELQPAHVKSLTYPIVDPDTCTGCGICADTCPVNAINIDSIAVIDESLCTGCRQCFEACLHGAIMFVEEG